MKSTRYPTITQIPVIIQAGDFQKERRENRVAANVKSNPLMMELLILDHRWQRIRDRPRSNSHLLGPFGKKHLLVAHSRKAELHILNRKECRKIATVTITAPVISF